MKKRGKGFSVGFYGTAAMGGGDPSTIVIKLRPDGSAVVHGGITDIGQGCKSVVAQIAAEELGLKTEQITVMSGDTDTGSFCLGTMGSRLTYVAGNSTIAAARMVKKKLFELSAPLLETSPSNLVTEDGKVFVKDNPERSIPIPDIIKMDPLILGTGSYVPERRGPNPKDGKWSPYNTFAFGAVYAEVTVETETGVVDVDRLVCTYDVGKAINPMMVEGQIEGGAVMSQGQAMMEVLHPYYPEVTHQPTGFHNYLIPTALDVPQIEHQIYECPSQDGPYGAKGIGEVTAIAPPAAIASAINDAIDVWIHELPITPEKILRALAEKTS